MQKAKWLSGEALQIAVKEREAKSKVANIHWIIKKARELQKNICFWFIDYAKALDCVDHNKLWEILKEMGIPDLLTSWEICMQVRKQQLEPDVKQWTGSKLEKEYIDVVYCHPAYFTSTEGTSC